MGKLQDSKESEEIKKMIEDKDYLEETMDNDWNLFEEDVEQLGQDIDNWFENAADLLR